jgi:hypothetical protein
LGLTATWKSGHCAGAEAKQSWGKEVEASRFFVLRIARPDPRHGDRG